MIQRWGVFLIQLICLGAVCEGSMRAQAQEKPLNQVERWTAEAAGEYKVFPDQIYLRASNVDLKLDVITTAPRTEKRPTVVYFHGGGWITGSKDAAQLMVLPYLARGMNVVNVDYRLASVATAPAAVEDCRCALRWVYQHANDFGFDLTRLVVMGQSAGGYLGLTTGLLTARAGYDNQCPDTRELSVAAIVNYYGITDVSDLLDGRDTRVYAQMWFAGVFSPDVLARRISPMQLVHKGGPPVITLHGDLDPVVPYQHAVRLHKALDDAGVPNKLVTIKGGGHGHWDRSQTYMAQEAVYHFLEEHGVLGNSSPPQQ